MNSSYDLAVGAKRMEKVEASMIRTILDRAAALRGEGKSVIPFSAGEPDFNTPSDIKEAAIRAITNNQTKYTSNRGYPALRKVLQGYIESETGISYNPDTEILVTSSAAEALNNVIMTFVDEGDEVIVLTPAFISYKCLVNMCGGKFIDIPFESTENGFQVNLGAVRAAITSKTKMLIMNNPSNPTGAVMSRETVEELCKLAKENNFLIFSDEIYSRLVYDDNKFVSAASIPGMKEHCVIVSGFSKTFAMTGWRLGYICTDERFAARILRTHQYSTTCSPTFIQVALAETMTSPRTQKQVSEMIGAFAKRRRVFMAGLDQIGGLSYVRPNGAFYIMVDVSALGMTSVDFSNRLLEEKYVATVPAVGLGDKTGKYVRISYATSEENIEEGLRRIKAFVEELRK